MKHKKISKADLQRIGEDYRSKMSVKDIAKKYGRSVGMIRQWAYRYGWRRLPSTTVNNHKHGRPRIFETPDDMQRAVNEYFDSCWKVDESGSRVRIQPYTITGLCLALNMTSETLRDYGTKNDFSAIVKRAKMQVENFVESQLFEGKQPTGPIFWLKCNSKWQDKNVHELSGLDGGGLKINVNFVESDKSDE